MTGSRRLARMTAYQQGVLWDRLSLVVISEGELRSFSFISAGWRSYSGEQIYEQVYWSARGAVVCSL